MEHKSPSAILPNVSETSHISVCICTYKRPELLKRLLKDLGDQETDGKFSYSIIVVDNDSHLSAEPVVSEFAASSNIRVRYCAEPRQNIALARNKAIENAEGDLIAFIDDDEFPIKRWLLTLFTALGEYGVDGVLGPVKPHFEAATPAWVVKSGIYDRPSYPTGLVIDWKKGRTGNVLFKKSVLASLSTLFNPDFRTGEDQDFFRRLIEKGHIFIWCHEAMAYEFVPPIRWSRRFILRRSLLRGATAVRHPSFGVREAAKSLIAVPVYAIVLPFSLLFGNDKCTVVLVKLFDHAGKLLALVGINPVGEPYVTS